MVIEGIEYLELQMLMCCPEQKVTLNNLELS